MQVKDVMTYGVEFINPRMTVDLAAQKMDADNAGCLIVGDGDSYCGIVTDRDIVTKAVVHGKDPKTTPVSEIMTDYIVTCYLSDDLADTARIMEKNEIRRIIVLDYENKPIATLSTDDFLVWGVVNENFQSLFHSDLYQAI